ncbi:MAG: Ribosomal RNA small subunit methyltransferase I [Chlamydiia bacterium]|nr:Ribosomal RNA small subunit methyltransferase I [Chlamydiia bacterium]
MLFLVPTPIGNLKDITFRAIDILSECDYILCEDTRKTIHLLNHYNIKKKLISFYKEKERALEEKILDDLKNDLKICLVSDAGTPAINDPGTHLIAKCHEADIKVNSLPGACSIPTALALSGLEFEKFQFLGFFPKKEKEKKELIESILSYIGVSIFFESPKRILKTIAQFPKDCDVFVAKELSKIHESLIKVTSDSASDFEESLTRGEICVLVKGNKAPSKLKIEDELLMKKLLKHLSQRDAVKIASEITGKKKQSFYN